MPHENRGAKHWDCSSALGSRAHNGLCFLGTVNVCHRVMRFFFSGVLILMRLVTIARLAAFQFRTSGTEPTVPEKDPVKFLGPTSRHGNFDEAAQYGRFWTL